MTPIRINLLPYRQLKKAHQQRMFAIFAAVIVAGGLAVVVLGQALIMNAKSSQDRRNVFLRDEITKLDKQIAEIQQLKEKTQDLLARKDVVESLQSNRDEAVHLFDELAKRLPDGLYLKSVRQTGDMVALSGYAQSSARVSTLMRSLEETALFEEPVLVEVKSAQVGPLRVNEFALNVKLTKRANAENNKSKGGKP
jgi:type IV pilus assembly protein PilN